MIDLLCHTHLQDVAIGTEQVEDIVTVHLALGKSIDHEHGSTASYCWRAHDTVGSLRSSWDSST